MKKENLMSIKITCDECGAEAAGRWLEKPLHNLPPQWELTLKFYFGSKKVIRVLCGDCSTKDE